MSVSVSVCLHCPCQMPACRCVCLRACVFCSVFCGVRVQPGGAMQVRRLEACRLDGSRENTGSQGACVCFTCCARFEGGVLHAHHGSFARVVSSGNAWSFSILLDGDCASSGGSVRCYWKMLLHPGRGQCINAAHLRSRRGRSSSCGSPIHLERMCRHSQSAGGALSLLSARCLCAPVSACRAHSPVQCSL